ncbi:MAG: hypothetical protein AAGB29_02475 [Planctomycetota bacterium]
MPSWVRFSVAVYLGLLLAGAILSPEPIVADEEELSPPPVRLPWVGPDGRDKAGAGPREADALPTPG